MPIPTPSGSLRLVRAGQYQGTHTPVLNSSGTGVAVEGRWADPDVVRRLDAAQTKAFADAGLGHLVDLDEELFAELATATGERWEDVGRENSPKIRPLYMISHDGKIYIGLGTSMWERVLAARDVLGPLSEAERDRLFKVCEATTVPAGPFRAGISAPMTTSAIVSTNMLPVRKVPTETGEPQYEAIFTIRQPHLGDRPSEIALIGGGTDPIDIVNGAWNPMDTMARERKEEMSDSIDNFVLLSAGFGVQPDGQFPVTLVADVSGTPYEEMLAGHLRSQDGKFEHRSFLRVPMTLDGLTAALCAPKSRDLEAPYQACGWTPWAVAAAHIAAAQFLTREEQQILQVRTATVPAMEAAWNQLLSTNRDLAEDMNGRLPDLDGPSIVPEM